MVKLGLTGGIGSGKSTIAKVFISLGVPVYFADIEAKKFLKDPRVIESLRNIFGAQVVGSKGFIDKAILASIVFKDENELSKLNSLIHPLLKKDFQEWCDQHINHSYVVKEAAILFEAGFDRSVDKVLTISAPQEERIARVMTRDQVNRQMVLDRITKQWTDEEREQYADYTINNKDSAMILDAVLKIHEELRSN